MRVGMRSLIGLLVGAALGAAWGFSSGYEGSDSALGTGLICGVLGALVGIVFDAKRHLEERHASRSPADDQAGDRDSHG